MPSSADELADLRRRVESLELQIHALTAASATDSARQQTSLELETPPRESGIEPDITAAPPPPLPPPIPPASPARPSRRELSSSVIVASLGGFIFLLGAIYGLTVSIQRGWISPLVRVLLGVGVGGLLAAVAINLVARERRRLGLALLTAGLGTAVFACYYGGLIAEVIDRAVGFGGAVVATGVAGWTAARYKFGGAMVAATALALLAPLIFWQGPDPDIRVLAYLMAVVLAQATVYYLTETGANWRIARWMGLSGLSLVAVAHHDFLSPSARLLGLTLLAAIYGGLLVLVWLPRHPERPGHTVGLTTSISAVIGLGFALILDVTSWPSWVTALPLGVQAILLATLIPLARRRLADTSADAGLAVTAAGFSVVAVLVVLEDTGDLLLWAVVALAATLAARFGPIAEKTPLRAGALLYLGFASLSWMIAVQDKLELESWPFLNTTWLGGIVLGVAWWQFARLSPAASGPRFGLIVAQVIVVHGLAAEWIGRQPSYYWDDLPMAALLGTLTYALAGLAQWYVGVRSSDSAQAKPLRIIGYVWIAIAVIKLFMVDLARTSTENRAIAALVVGTLFIAAALLVDRLKPSSAPPAPPPED